MSKTLKELRTLVAKYMGSEGCSCCENIEKHVKDNDALARALNVPRFSDDSGNDWGLFR